MKAIATALLVVTASIAHAQSIDPTGHWKGAIEIPNNPMDFEMDLARNDRGELIGTVTAGADRATLPLVKVSLDGSSIVFYGRSDQQFHAQILSSGTVISGTAALSGYDLPFSMGRTGDAKIDPPPVGRAVTKSLEGVWNGALSASGRTLRLIVTIVNRPDGTALAQSVSVDEGGLTLPTVVVQNDAHVTFEIRGVRSSWAGELNAAGTELRGVFTQGGVSIPLTLTR